MSETLDQEIIVAAENGDLEGVKKALDAGANPSAMGPNSGALHCAAFNGHEAVVELLLDKGTNVDLKDAQSYYPLHLAAARGYVSIAERLVKSGANLEALTAQNGTALHVAAASNYPELTAALLKAGANLEAKDTNGLTPLAAAASLGNAAVVRLLLEHKADVNTKDVGADTPLIKALRYLYGTRISNWIYEERAGEKVVRYEITKGCFRRDGDYNPIKTEDLGDLLSIEEQRTLVSKEWGPKEHSKYLDTFEAVALLIEAGANVNAVNESKQSPMNMACHIGDANLIKQLHDQGASTKIRGYQNATPLHRAAGSGRLDGLEQLLSLGTDLAFDAVDDFGWTALHYLADIGGPLKMVTLLLEKQIDPTIKSTDSRGEGMSVGCTAREIAIHWKDTKLAEALK